MGFSRFRAGIALRAALLFVTLVAVAEMLARTQWYITIALCIAAALVQVALLMRFAAQSSRAVARFLEAVSFDDTSQSFAGLTGDGVHRELGVAMTRRSGFAAQRPRGAGSRSAIPADAHRACAGGADFGGGERSGAAAQHGGTAPV